jgi:ATP-binding cassette subfamily B protein/subfamily B ATP-binding cassette protein MsbA
VKRRYWRAAWTFLPYLRPYKSLAVGSVLLTLVGALTDLAGPWPFALLIGYVLVGKPPPAIITAVFGSHTEVLITAAVAGGFLLVFLAHGIAVLSEWINTKLDLSIALDFRTKLFAHVLDLSDFFFDEAAPGDYMYRINYEARSVGAMAVAIPPLAQSVITIVGYFLIALTLDPLLALATLTVVPFIYYSTGFYAKRIEPKLVTVRGLEGISLTMVNTAMSMIHVITGFNRQSDEHRRFRRQGEWARDMRVDVTVRQTVYSMAVALITAGGTALVLDIGAHHVLSGQTSITALLVLMAYIASFYKPLEQLSTTIAQLQVLCVSIMFSRQLLERKPLVNEKPDAVELKSAKGRIRFRNIGFDYPARPNVLREIDFDIRPGELVALVGPTGAGKSTLLQLIPRFFDPASGKVEIDGHDLRDLRLDSLRDKIAVVRQDPLLFPRSIAENIAYSRPGATAEEVEAAARAANAHDFIVALPDGYQTVLGDRGGRISGGERQRLALARAFLKDAPILLLDEPTSAIDSKTEAAILEALERLTAGRTTIIAAHRLSTVRSADRVLVLERGRLVESGTPAELLASGGLFATLSRLQSFNPAVAAVTANGSNGHRPPEEPPAVEVPASTTALLIERNTLVQLVDRARARHGSYTGAIHLRHGQGKGTIYAEAGEFHSARGDLGEGDELVILAMSWHDDEFTLTVDPNATLPENRNITMSYEAMVSEAARRQTAAPAPRTTASAPAQAPPAPAPPVPRSRRTASASSPAPAPAPPAPKRIRKAPPPAQAGARRAPRKSRPPVAPTMTTAITSRRPSIVVLGSMSAMAVGGVVWQTLQYLVGFQRLGYDVFYVETHGVYPRVAGARPGQDSINEVVELIGSAMSRVNMGGRWCYVALNHDERHYGMSREELHRRYREAEVIINLHGGTVPRPEHTGTGRLVYLETDPVAIEVGVAAGNQTDIDFLALHNFFFSYGENYGAPDCRVPQTERFNFLPTRPPIVLEYWPFARSAPRGFTTVGNWNQFQDVTVDGETYSWSKRVEFMKFLDLPKRTGEKFELALSQCGPEDAALLREHGWQVVDALEFSYDAESYRDYIASSRAEFTVAKDQNVRLRSGWFSDRSATYLASGRPVVTQDTAFGNILPTGAGLFSFNTMDEAAAAVELVNKDYEKQRLAARRIAEEWFDSDVVLGQLLRDLGLPVPGRRVPVSTAS